MEKEREGYDYVVCEECGTEIRGLFDAVQSQEYDEDSGHNIDIWLCMDCADDRDSYHRELSETVYRNAYKHIEKEAEHGGKQV